MSQNTLFTMILESESLQIFVVCGECWWCATYLNEDRLSSYQHRCPRCGANGHELSSFVITPSELFSFSHSYKPGIKSKHEHKGN